MENKIEISVIIPVYNVEQYIEKCVKSILSQTIINKLEIILVDDGSTDKSVCICDMFASQYANIKVIHKPNGGVSSARNAGLVEAIGTYIAFVDADDYVSVDFYECLLQCAIREDAEVAIVDFNICHSNGDITKKRKEKKQLSWNKEEAIRDFLAGRHIGINIFDKLFKRAVVLNISFVEGKVIGEDMYYIFQVLNVITKVVADFSHANYFYVIRDGSAMQKPFSSKFFDTLFFSKKIITDIDKNYPKFVPNAKAHLLHEQCKTIERIYIGNGRETYSKQYYDLIQEIRSNNIFSVYPYLSFKQYCGFLLMRVSVKQYIKIMKLLRI